MKQKPTIPVIRRKLLTWFKHNRRDLPWRLPAGRQAGRIDPYLIAVSEVMLQQTQVDRVKPKFLAWRRAWPTTKALANATLHDVLTMWSGLGYNSRGKRLRDAARAVMEKFDGRWPRRIDELEALPGFGPYTARAVASFAYNADVAVIDTNVRRVLSRIFFGVRSPKQRQLEELAHKIVPPGNGADWHAAVMDFGSAVCTSRGPKCAVCPVQQYCRAYPTILTEPQTSKPGSSVRFQETDRYYRGEILRQVVRLRKCQATTLVRTVSFTRQVDKSRVVRLINDLVNDGMLRRQGQYLRIAS